MRDPWVDIDTYRIEIHQSREIGKMDAQRVETRLVQAASGTLIDRRSTVYRHPPHRLVGTRDEDFERLLLADEGRLMPDGRTWIVHRDVARRAWIHRLWFAEADLQVHEDFLFDEDQVLEDPLLMETTLRCRLVAWTRLRKRVQKTPQQIIHQVFSTQNQYIAKQLFPAVKRWEDDQTTDPWPRRQMFLKSRMHEQDLSVQPQVSAYTYLRIGETFSTECSPRIADRLDSGDLIYDGRVDVLSERGPDEHRHSSEEWSAQVSARLEIRREERRGEERARWPVEDQEEP